VWDETSFFERLAGSKPEVIGVARLLLKWAKDHQPHARVSWGRGKQDRSYIASC
jgi:hypothetical protein